MPQPELFGLIEKFRNELLQGNAESIKRLVDAYRRIYEKLQPQIDGLTAQIEMMEEPKSWRVGKLDRLKQLQADIEIELRKYSAIVENEAIVGARQAIELAGAQTPQLVQAKLPGFEVLDTAIMQRWQSLRPEAVETLLGFLDPNGTLFKYLGDKWATDKVIILTNNLLESVALGRGPRETARLIRKDMGAPLDDALRISRTTQIYAHREATRANYAANDWLVRGWIWRCARNKFTCISCISMDGTEHKLDEQLNDHWNGRCYQEPITATYAELGIDIGGLPEPVKGGPAADWFKGLAESEQRDIMGKAIYKAYQAGAVDISQLSKEMPDKVFGNMRTAPGLVEILGQEKAKEYYARPAK